MKKGYVENPFVKSEKRTYKYFDLTENDLISIFKDRKDLDLFFNNSGHKVAFKLLDNTPYKLEYLKDTFEKVDKNEFCYAELETHFSQIVFLFETFPNILYKENYSLDYYLTDPDNFAIYLLNDYLQFVSHDVDFSIYKDYLQIINDYISANNDKNKYSNLLKSYMVYRLVLLLRDNKISDKDQFIFNSLNDLSHHSNFFLNYAEFIYYSSVSNSKEALVDAILKCEEAFKQYPNSLMAVHLYRFYCHTEEIIHSEESAERTYFYASFLYNLDSDFLPYKYEYAYCLYNNIYLKNNVKKYFYLINDCLKSAIEEEDCEAYENMYTILSFYSFAEICEKGIYKPKNLLRAYRYYLTAFSLANKFLAKNFSNRISDINIKAFYKIQNMKKIFSISRKLNYGKKGIFVKVSDFAFNNLQIRSIDNLDNKDEIIAKVYVPEVGNTPVSVNTKIGYVNYSSTIELGIINIDNFQGFKDGCKEAEDISIYDGFVSIDLGEKGILNFKYEKLVFYVNSKEKFNKLYRVVEIKFDSNNKHVALYRCNSPFVEEGDLIDNIETVSGNKDGIVSKIFYVYEDEIPYIVKRNGILN